MIAKIHSRSTVADVNATASALLNELNKHDFSADLYLAGLIENLTNSNIGLTDAIKEKFSSSDLCLKDEKRDFALRGLFHEVRANLFWPDSEVVAAAEVVNGVIGKYGIDTVNMAYATESANINAMVQVNPETYQTAVNVLTEIINSNNKTIRNRCSEVITNA